MEDEIIEYKRFDGSVVKVRINPMKPPMIQESHEMEWKFIEGKVTYEII